MVNRIDKYISKQVRKYRLAKNITQEELAEMLGLTRVSVVNMEKGKQSFTVKSLYLLCCIFKITPTDLFPEVKKASIKKIRSERVVVVYKRKPKFKITNIPKI